MSRLKIPILLSMLLICSLMYAETMYVDTQNGTLTFDTAEIQEITFDISSASEYEDLFSKIPIKLMQNYPNPFNVKNNVTSIKFNLKRQGKTEVSVFNIKGQKVKTLADKQLIPGTHKYIWDGNNNNGLKVSSGVYFYQVKQNGKTKTNKMIVIK